MKKTLRVVLPSFLLCGSLLLSSCDASQVIAIITQIASIAEKVAAASGQLTPTQALYFNAGLNCSNEAAIETANSDSTGRKSAIIALDCAGITLSTIPTGLNPEQLALAKELAATVDKLLNALPAAPAAAPAALTAAKPAPATTPTEAQKAKLEKLKERIVEARVKLARKVAK